MIIREMRRAASFGLFFLATLRLCGQSADGLIHQAQEEIKAGRYAEAEKDLSQAADAEPAKWNLWYNLALVRVQLGENGTAIQAFERARRADLRQAPPYFGLGLVYVREGDSEKARKAYEDGLARDPNDVVANQNYAFLMMQKHDYLDAVAPLEKLKTLEPENVPSRVSLIEAYLKAGLGNQEEHEIHQFLSARIATMQDELSLGKLLIADGAGKAAGEVLQHAATTWPEAADPHGDLGLILIEDGQFETAVNELGKAAQLDPNSPKYALGLGEALLRWRHDPVARDYLLKIQAKFGELPLYQFELGLAYFDLTEFPLALKEFDNLAQQQPRSGQVQFLLAATHQELGELDQAESDYRRAIALKQDEPTYYLGLAALLRKVHPEDLAEPVRLSEKALALSPDNEEARLLLASCYQAQGKLTEAQTLLETVIAGDPGSRTAHVALAQVYFRQKKIEDAQNQEAIAAKLEERKQNEISPWGPGGIGKP